MQKEAIFFVKEKLSHALVFSQLTGHGAETFKFQSISEASQKLKSYKKIWTHQSLDSHRRAELIQQALPTLKKSRTTYLKAQVKKPGALGVWVMMDANTLILAPECSSTYLKDEVEFEEDKVHPPNRAYLKLWELFSFVLHPPEKSQKTVDMGSSPGGWTWVLAELGAEVYSVDKAPLKPELLKKKNIHYQSGDVFKIHPNHWGPLDWFFSDLICTPEKLLELVQKWNKEGMAENFVCTLKFKGDADFKIIQDWMEKFNSSNPEKSHDRVWGFQHLKHNKNEVTWYCVRKKYLRE